MTHHCNGRDNSCARCYGALCCRASNAKVRVTMPLCTLHGQRWPCAVMQRLSRRLWKQGSAAAGSEADDSATADTVSSGSRQPQPALLPPFVLSQAAAQLCPPRVANDGQPLPQPQPQSPTSNPLLDGWHLLMPQW